MKTGFLSSAERRVYTLLDAYGSRPEAWPDEERQAAIDCIAGSPPLQRYLAQTERLDDLIRSTQAATLPAKSDVLALRQRILTSLPDTVPQTDRHSPTLRRRWPWQGLPRYAFASLAAGIFFIGLFMAPHTLMQTPKPVATASFAAWSWYDITGQDLATNPQSAAMTMTDLLDLETDQDTI